MRPSQRPIHDSFKKHMVLQVQSFDSNQDWEQKINGFQTFESQKNSNTDGSLIERRKSSSGINPHAQLTQTMSKNLSFGHPFQFEYGSGQSLKNREYASAQVNSSRRVNPHQINLPLQILSESSSEGERPNEETQKVGQLSHFHNQHQDHPP